VGKKKAAIMAERLQKVNPLADIQAVVQFYSPYNSEDFLQNPPSLVIDCIDNITAKCHLLASCVKKNIPVICAGGASAKVDPLRIKFSDLADTHTDPFLLQVRRVLRQKHDFPAEGKFGIPTVFSDEVPTDPHTLSYDKGEGFKCVCPQGQNNLHSCDNRSMIYGTASYVTGAFGLVIASRAVDFLKNTPAS
jgi:tRNA A37 threonylcarbamoyladenosine dehydratase